MSDLLKQSCTDSQRRASVLFFASARSAPAWLFGGAAVTLDAILKVRDAFLQMFSFDPGCLVFVTAITGVAAKFILDMAGHASSVVVLV